VVGTAKQDTTERAGRAVGESRRRGTHGGPCQAGAGGPRQQKQSAALKAAGASNSSRVKELGRPARQRNILSILDDRLGHRQQLVTLYVTLGQPGQLQHKIMLHMMLLQSGSP